MKKINSDGQWKSGWTGGLQLRLAAVLSAALMVNVQAAGIKVENTELGGGVPSANAKVGTPDTQVPSGFSLTLIAQGIEALENPSAKISRFGFLTDLTKTEPDENTYLVLDHNPGGPTPGYDYGRHFLYQGHENAGNLAYITRINLDVVNPDHRITLLTPDDTATGLTGFNRIDGSGWNPHSKTLLFSQEDSVVGGVIEMGTEWDAASGRAAGLRTLYGSIGHGGFEGIHPDDQGNIFIVEDAGGTSVGIDPANPATNKFAKIPNSYVFRFVPYEITDLSKGKLQALQVSIGGNSLTYVPIDAAHPVGDAFSDNQLLLHTPGTSWPCKWITIHDTATNTTAFDANLLARTAGATPFKRPENGQFQPGSKFRSFFFVITGDTDARSGNVPALAARGGWGGIFRIDLDKTREKGTVSLVALGDADHAAFDNAAFAGRDVLMLTEDRGDTLHNQLNRLDSVWAFDVKHGGSARLVALGQDRLAIGVEDNEPTGLHYSDGDSSVQGLLGDRSLKVRNSLLFFTQQHGENNVYVIAGDAEHSDDDHDDRD